VQALGVVLLALPLGWAALEVAPNFWVFLALLFAGLAAVVAAVVRD
jgi:hypothetical protein